MLKDKVAVVTGGTRGIGLAIVRKYLENGAKVILCGSREESVNKAIDILRSENDSYEVYGYYPNLCDEKEVSELYKDIIEKYGHIDILVNNAGVSATTDIYNYTVEEFDKTMDLNVKAAFVCSKEVVKYMKEQKAGVIINTSSMVSIYGQGRGVAYPTSKFAINGMTKSLARELGKDNIRVNAVAPGVTNTDMVASLPEQYIAPILKTIPLGRIGEPEEVANAFLFLASDMASYITGAILSVDGATIN